jgi:hypothetical protein
MCSGAEMLLLRGEYCGKAEKMVCLPITFYTSVSEGVNALYDLSSITALRKPCIQIDKQGRRLSMRTPTVSAHKSSQRNS